MFPKTFIFQATIKQYQTAENIDFAQVFSSLYFQICTVVKEQDMYTELKHRAQPLLETCDALRTKK